MAISSTASRIKDIRTVLSLSQRDFAQSLGITQSALSQIENGLTNISLVTLEQLMVQHNVNPDWLLFGEKPLLRTTFDKAAATPPNMDNTVYLVQATAHADYPDNCKNQEFLESFKRYEIPKFGKEGSRMFEIEGDSMEPTIFNGDIVIVEMVSNIKSVGDGKLYVVVTKQGVVAKRIYKYEDGYSALVMKSDNPKFQSYKISAEDIVEIWEIKAKITNDFLTRTEKNVALFSDLDERMEELEKRLSLIESKKSK